MRDIVRILHLEDSKKDIELIHALITSAGIRHTYFLADDRTGFMKILETENIDIILADYSMPGFSGNEALREVGEKYSHIPFIFVSGTIGEDAAINSMLNGATDYVLKHKLDRLVPAIKRALREQEIETQRKLAEKLLKESQELLQKARKLAKLGVWDWNMQTDIVTWTDELYQITGLDPKLPAPLFAEQSLIFTPSSFRILSQALDNATMTGEPFKLELEIVQPDGSRRDLIFFGAATTNGDNQITSLYGTTQDITESKNAERELIRAKEHAEESDKLKSSFLANVSHEIRTPMSGILGFAELLKEPNLPEKELHDYLGNIEDCGFRMLNILNDIMDISKIESGQAEVWISETDINKQMECIYQQYAAEVNRKGLQLVKRFVLPTKDALIFTDHAKLHSILCHLLNNAIKFTETGSIEFGYAVKPAEISGNNGANSVLPFSGEQIGTAEISSNLEFYVRDSGIGIHNKRHEDIFKSFLQVDSGNNRTFQGAGLGLSISKAYVELLGGEIWVASEEGAGSTFYFTIPFDKISGEQDIYSNRTLTEAC